MCAVAVGPPSHRQRTWMRALATGRRLRRAFSQTCPIRKFRASPCSISASCARSATIASPSRRPTRAAPRRSPSSASIREALDANGFADVAIDTTLSPPWSTDWISDEGREKLRAYGIAPPPKGADAAALKNQTRCGMPALRLVQHRRNLPLRLDAVQSALALQGVRGAVRPVQVPLMSDRLSQTARGRSEARNAGCGVGALRAAASTCARRSRSAPASISPSAATSAAKKCGAIIRVCVSPSRRRAEDRREEDRRRRVLRLGQRRAESRRRRST